MGNPDIDPSDYKIVPLDEEPAESLAGKSEKLTLNLPVMVLAQIDALVDAGNYQNRAEFLRFSVLKNLEEYPINERKPWLSDANTRMMGGVGLFVISNSTLEKTKERNQMLKIRVAGILKFSGEIDPYLFAETVHSVKVWGVFKPPLEIKRIIDAKKLLH